jgi:hypothetical protein
MSAQDNGGPAFPLHAKDGMTMRDYFAARAPAPMSWFTPTIPPRPEDDWRVGERRCTNHNYALEWAKEHGGYITNHNADAQTKWANESHLIALCQWNYTYADAMLAERKKEGV